MRTSPVHLSLTITVLFAAVATPVVKAAEGITSPDTQVTWCWGSQRRSANVPFFRIIAREDKIVLETKDYMHSNFVADTKNITVRVDRVEFSYWYKPLGRWARCQLAVGTKPDTMAGSCEGEVSVGKWGIVASFLWRC